MQLRMSLRVAEMLTKVRRALASRYLFDNWLSLLIKYALIRLDFNVKLMAKVNGCAFELSPEVFGCLVNRASRGLIKLIRCGDHDVFVVYMNEIQVPVEEFEKSDAYAIDLAIKNGWAYDVTDKYWFKNGIKFRHMHWPILEVFDFGNYEGIDVDGKVVIDVGAFVGDTAIYFALKGAKGIIAIEPLPANYEELLDNVNLNGMRNKINVINAALGSKHGVVKVPRNVPVNIRGSSIDMYKKHGIGKLIDIKSITLSD